MLEKKLNPVIPIPPQAEEKSFHLHSSKISQSLALLRNDEVLSGEKRITNIDWRFSRF